MKCTHCGRKIRIGDEFCSKCGRPIEPDIIYEANDIRDEDADIEGGAYSQSKESAPKKASSWTSKGIAAAICIAVAFAVAIISLNVSNMLSKNKESEDYDISEIEETTTTTTPAPTTTTTTEPESYTQDSGESFWESLFPSGESDYGRNEAYGDEIMEYLEGVGNRIKGAADDYIERGGRRPW